jgi:cellular nucleic acid-binding protein
MVHIYILKLSNGKWYIGKTTNLDRRVDEHINGNGAEWCKIHPMIGVEESYPDSDDFDEDKYVKKYMSLYGIDNVRGGSYSQINLSIEQQNLLKSEIFGATNKCFSCGSNDHFINECTQTKCYVCGKFGHIAKKCTSDKSFRVKNNIKINKCYQCGKVGHIAKNCILQNNSYWSYLKNPYNWITSFFKNSSSNSM